MVDIAEGSRRRRELRRQYKEAFAAVSAALVDADPIGLIACGAPSDEYEPEVGTVLPRLASARNADDVRLILHEEFVRWFGSEVAGAPDAYSCASVNVWRAWEQVRDKAGSC